MHARPSLLARPHRIAAAIASTALVACIAGSSFGATPAAAVNNTLDNQTMSEVIAYSSTYFNAPDSSLMGVHRALGMQCADCHTEAPDADPAALNTAGKRAGCLAAGCHDNWEAIEEATGSWSGKATVYNPTGIYNPHSNHRGDADCGDCHKMHSEQTLTCAQCHDITVPDGWSGYY